MAGVTAWAVAGEAMSAVRARELRAMTDDEARRAVRDLLALLPSLPVKEGGSGLVEQQRLFSSTAVHADRVHGLVEAVRSPLCR